MRFVLLASLLLSPSLLAAPPDAEDPHVTLAELVQQPVPDPVPTRLPHCAKELARFCHSRPACASHSGDDLTCLKEVPRAQLPAACRRDLSAMDRAWLDWSEGGKIDAFAHINDPPSPRRKTLSDACADEHARLCPAIRAESELLDCVVAQPASLGTECSAAVRARELQYARAVPARCNLACACPGVPLFDEGAPDRWSTALIQCMEKRLADKAPLPPGCGVQWNSAKQARGK